MPPFQSEERILRFYIYASPVCGKPIINTGFLFALLYSCRMVHPHKRGESGMFIPGVFDYATVHPHKRGESGFSQKIEVVVKRFTPTSVGKADDFSGVLEVNKGSPPQAWGKPQHLHSELPQKKGSPPQAWGKPLEVTPTRSKEPVHPHKRGESGSRSQSVLVGKRFTPTSVGKAMSLTLLLL
jgi:hypothetical protein